MKLNEIDNFLLENVPSNPHDIVSVTAEHFKKGRTTILYRLKKLVDAGLVLQQGTRNKVHYEINPKAPALDMKEFAFHYDIGDSGEDEIWVRDILPLVKDLPKNIISIAQYGFTEMFNNVIDHSQGKNARVRVQITADDLKIRVVDDGIGVFRNVANYFGIKDLRDAVVRLHKGKVTTDKKKHTGQGIFFTSRAFDIFVLVANGFTYYKDNSEKDDWYFERQGEEEKLGTGVELIIGLNSPRILKDVFDSYSKTEDMEFDSSHFRIALSVYEGDQYVSRSQAKRLLEGLGDFKSIDIDFKGINFVGQAFVDEIFGVFGLANPNIHFNVVNANDDVKFMIKRGLSDRKFPLERVTMD